MKKLTLIGLVLLTGVYGFFVSEQTDKWNDDTNLAEVMYAMGKEKPTHYLTEIDSVKARMGKEIVYFGRAIMENGRKSNYVSKYFVCTDCHNQEREDPFLPNSDPDDRLDYVAEKGIPFLQGTTFWGMVNRDTWYNQDYVKKYGKLVEKAHNDLGESTQLCAVECSSGRPLEDWEEEALIHYYWTLQLKMGDLELKDKEWNKLRILAGSEKDRGEVIEMLESKYMTYSPAHFVEPNYPLGTHYEVEKEADKIRGEKLFESSCMTCHKAEGPSLLVLDKSKYTKKKFRKHMNKDTDFNLYKIIRKGTYAEPGHKQYMPHYPLERMSNQQVEDLRAYIESR